MSEARGDQLVQEAARELNKFSLFTSSSDKRDKARELLLKAATVYKTEELWAKAAGCYDQCMELSKKSKQDLDFVEDACNGGTMHVKAGNSAKSEAVRSQAIDVLDAGQTNRGAQAGRLCIEIGELGGPDSDKWFARGMQYLKAAGQGVAAGEVQAKMAETSARKGDYHKAMQQFDKIAKEFQSQPLTRGTARKFFFMSLLCRIATVTPTNLVEGIEGLKKQFDEVQDIEPQFTSLTREHMLVSAVVAALESEDADAFRVAVDDYDNICPMDTLKSRLLLRGKQAITRGGTKAGLDGAETGEAVDEEDCR